MPVLGLVLMGVAVLMFIIGVEHREKPSIRFPVNLRAMSWSKRLWVLGGLGVGITGLVIYVHALGQ